MGGIVNLIAAFRGGIKLSYTRVIENEKIFIKENKKQQTAVLPLTMGWKIAYNNIAVHP